MRDFWSNKMNLLITFAKLLILVASTAMIHDPMNIFCGSLNCYEVLGLNRTADVKEIKKAFRTLSLTQHPDKSKDSNATETFRLITKAYKVLTGNESKPLFDYYLDHPRDYFKVSGHHYIRAVPKSNVFIVIFGVLALISWFIYAAQYKKWERFNSLLKQAIANNWSVKNGGSKQTQEKYLEAVALYDAYIKEVIKSTGKQPKFKMNKDPIFQTLVDKVVNEMIIDEEFRKPELKDLFICKIFLAPYNIVMQFLNKPKNVKSEGKQEKLS